MAVLKRKYVIVYLGILLFIFVLTRIILKLNVLSYINYDQPISTEANNREATSNKYDNQSTVIISKQIKEEPKSLPPQPTKTKIKPNKIVANSPPSITKGQFIEQKMSWNEFVSLPYHSLQSQIKQISKEQIPSFTSNLESINICPQDMETKLATPQLQEKDFQWCKWAIDPNGGAVEVGKSWGKIDTKPQRERFDTLNCNSVSKGKNPSCDDSWGDIHLKHWLKHTNPTFTCDASKSSNVQCLENDNNDLFCTIENVMLDFNRVKKKERPHLLTPSKDFESNFLSSDCKTSTKKEPLFPFPHLYSPQLASDTCDIVYNGTIILYSHDDIRNLGHTLNDIMNVWIMLWLENIASFASQIDFLNVDSFKQGHNFYDQPNEFFTHYHKTFAQLYPGQNFQNKRVCIKKVLMQPNPPRFFIWESWFVNLPCSFIGPSSLYQRWNMHIRNQYQVLKQPQTNEIIQILFIVRSETFNLWGAQRSSRLLKNTDQVSASLQRYIDSKGSQYKLVVQDLGKLTMQEQIQLISKTSIMIGIHGAGISSSMHMSIGSKYCCGVLEVYPRGEFFPILGHGNMARKMGLHYDRLDLPDTMSQDDGARIPPESLIEKLEQMIQKILQQPTCVVSSVLQNPYYAHQIAGV